MAETFEGATLEGAIAVVGLAGRFPGARNLRELWKNLRAGVESVRFLSDEEMAALGVPEAVRRDPAWVPAVAHPEGIDELDAPFFGISHREAEILDPQQRLFLEACWAALEDAGHAPGTGGGVVSVFGGATTSTYLLFNLARNPQVLAAVDPLQLIVGNAVDSLATRVSYKLDLKGASHSVQCACSTSLVAVHLACQSLLNQECDLALAGGVSLNVAQRGGYRFEEDSILSPDGHCRAFDAGARGTLFGGGVGVVALKRLEDALAARDTVRAVILGSAVNNDGAVKVGYTAPSVSGQAAVIAEALSVAGVDAETIGYLEAHGTGTALGDPIEIQALTKAFRAETRKKGFCALGTIKSNLGHLDIASGVAGLIKTVLALENREIPPSLHFERPNPRIDFAASPVYVNRTLQPWPAGEEPRRAGVSSFGFGGTNAHVILEEAPEAPARPAAADRPWRLLALSAKTEEALAAATADLAEHFRERPDTDPGDAAYTLLAGRRTFGHRRIAVVRDAADAAAILAGSDPGRVFSAVEREEPRERPVAFLFPGQGAQHAGMGRDLYETEPVFRWEIDRAAERLAPALGLDLRRLLFPPEAEKEEAGRLLGQTRITQPALFAVEHALARLWISWGVTPAAMLGHSIGEYVAACLAGVFSFEDALALVAERGRLIGELPPGAMLAVPLPEEEARELLGSELDLAAVNEPGRSVIAGPLAAIAALEERLGGSGVACRRLHTSHAFHSRALEPALAPFTEAVRRVRLAEPRIPFVSNVTGTWILPEEATDPGYWARHLRGTVRFADGVATLLAEPGRVLLEVGPGRTLTTHAARQAAGRPAIASLRHPREEGSDLASLLTAVGRLWLAGHRLDAEKLFAGQERRRIPLPSYPFERHRYWIEPGEDWSAAAASAAVAPAQTLHARPALETAYVAPRSEFEEEVAGIWREVLGVREVGAHDSFLDLGGDSLLATRLMSRLRDELGVDLPMERLFERPTVAAVAAAVRKAEAPAGRIPRRLRDGKSAFPLSFAQERLWFFDRLEPGSALYNIPAGIEAVGRLDVAALAAALTEIVRRHEALRTTFPGGEGEPVQEIHPARPVALPVVDLSALPEPARGEEARRLATAEARRPFDLARGPLLRTLLLRLGEEEHLAVLTIHHIVSDGWSMGVLVREIAALYPALASGRPSPLPELPLQYADYAVWQRKHLRGEVFEEQLAYWRGQLAGAPAALELPTDHPRPPVQTFRGAQAPVVLPPALVQALRELGRETGSTLFMIVLAAFEALLERHTDQEDLLVGSPIANRNRAEIEGLIGFFVNTLVMRGDLSGDPTFAELLARVRETALAAYAHQDLPFERLVEELHPARDLSRGPLVQVMASLQKAQAEALELPGLLLTPRDLDSGTAKFELTLHLAEGAGSAAGWIEYNADLFEAPTVARLAGQLVRLLEAAPAGLHRPAADLPLFSEAEQQALFAEWNAAPGEPLPEGALHRMVFAQARRRPDAVALVAGEETWTYGQLARRAEAIARRLRKLGVEPEARVGLSMAKSPERIAALLGILLAGGAYVPLDPAYPQERLAFILEDSGARVLVTEPDLGGEDPEEGGPVPDDVLPDHLAYVIYTSGSTGRPKGVLVRHAGVCRVIAESIRLFGLGPESRVPHLASLSFDASVLEMFSALAAGGTLLLLPGGLLGPDLADELRRHRATHLVASPALLDTLPGSALPDLCTVTVGGEACSAETAAVWSGRVALFNCYAPTETTIYSTTGRCRPGARRVPSVGRPIAGARAYVLDRRLRPVPLGAQGEIYVGGEGVARGYHGRPDLTAERFVPDPWSPEPGARLYRTGDLARRLPGGELEFAGRNDSQVKLRGFRVELGEVETALARHEAVERAVAVVREDAPGDRRLVAYAVLREGEAAPPAALRTFLKGTLPEFMVPAAVVLLDALPLTPTGKPDKKALPAPEGSRPETEYVTPRSEAERVIAGIWREVLRVDRVGANDNFFDLGGHSVLMAQVHAKLGSALGRELKLLDLFKFPTVGTLAAYLAGGEAAPVLVRRPAVQAGDTDIAVIGMAGRFPGAGDLRTFWENLAAGVESITFFTDEELRAAGVPASDLADPGYVRARGIVDGVDRFDAAFFGYSPREAEVIDPQQRLFLECAWEAFEEAGYDPAVYPGDVGVYAGVGMNTYVFNLLPDPEILDSVGNFQITISNDKDFLASRVSYKLGLRGPSLSVQTACSTSLVAIHLACRSLLSGECDAALAGGVSIRIPQEMGHHYREGAVFSPDGHCRAFDERAGGFVGGNGAGVVLLKRLSDALRDGDPVRAVIKGSAVNNDGAVKVGYTAPAVEGQARVIAQALAAAGVEPGTVSYVEAHGTGTDLGDPVEIAALTRAFGPGTAKGSCAVGSVKTNIGHLDSAAGVAGFIKAVLALEHREIPPTLHFERPNPKLELGESPFFIAARPTPWETRGIPRRAGVSSMGIGGTNAHVVLEEAPPREPAAPGREWQLLPLSARSEAALDEVRARLARHLEERSDGDLADVAWTLQAGRRRFEHRAVALGRDAEEAVRALETELLTGSGEAGSVAFLFSGQGSQHPGMAAELYRSEKTFREEVDRACDLLAPRLGLDLRTLLFAEGEAGRLAETEITQPALFVIEHALARLWMSWGIRPAALLGHSIGEYVAACLSGVFSLEDALALVAERGRLMGAMEPGAMLSVPLPEAEILPLLTPGLSVAAVNAPARTVVAGPEPAVEELAWALDGKGVKHRRLHTSHAFHSELMEPAVGPFLAALRRVRFHPPQIPFVSNVTGTWITAEEATDPEYWARHLRGTVRFADGIATLLSEPGRALLEVGPGNSLATLAREAGAPVALASLPHPSDRRPEIPFLLATLGRLWMAGIEVDWSAFHAGETRRRVPLPTYPFERRRYWIEGSGPLGIGRGTARRPGLEKRPDPADWLSVPTWKRGLPVPPVVSEEPRRWLLVLDEGGVGERLAGLLRAAGHEVATAPPAGSREAYAALLAEPPRSVVHLAGLDEAAVFHDLIALAQGIGDAGLSGPLDLTVVARGLFDVTGGEALAPEKATLFGPARVIPWEYPHVSCRVLDVASGDPEALRREIAGGEGSLVALRGPHRWVPGWEPLRLDGAPVQPPRVREDGVYLITGGTGGIGLEVAASLAQGRKVRLALLGRTSRRPRRLLDLEAMGARILVLAADVADRSAMERALAEVRERFGAIHGVVHAAGVPGGALIQRHVPAESERVLAPRIGGLKVLADLLADEPLDFFVLTSAAGALSGEPGQVDLTAAGAFLDAWAQSRSGRPGPYTVSIDWDTWREVGMAADVAGLPEPLRRAREQALATGIAPAEGREVFARILERAALPQVVVSTKDLNAVLEHLSAMARGAEEEAAPARSTYARPDLKSAYAEPRDETERALAAIWQDLLGLERVGIDDNFFDLGGHSLLATQVVSRVREELGAEVPLEALFEAPTISGLARAVASRTGPSAADALEALLREIEGLSPEEAQEAYAQESHERL